MSPALIEIPEFNFLMIDGRGDPNNESFQKAIEILFFICYKKSTEQDYVVMPLEGLWWANDTRDFIKGNRNKWQWTLMIMQPEFIGKGL